MIANASRDLSVYVILDPSVLPSGRSIVDLAASLGATGCGALQLRDKHATGRELVATARAILAATNATQTLLFINDRVDVALASGAHGVHVGPNDVEVADIRRFAGELIVGGSAGSVDAAKALVAEGAHYLGCGAVYEARAMKADASAPRGADFVRQIVEAVDVPVFGIGGIDASNARPVVDAGATGVAVIREVVAADDAVAAYTRLRNALKS